MGRFKSVRIAGICAGLLMVVAGTLGFSSSALAETKAFTKAGCETWEVPSGVSSVMMDALELPERPPIPVPLAARATRWRQRSR